MITAVTEGEVVRGCREDGLRVGRVQGDRPGVVGDGVVGPVLGGDGEGVGHARRGWAREAGDDEVVERSAVDEIPDWVPLIDEVAVSVAVIDWVPAVFSVAFSEWVPLLAETKS